MSTLPNQIVDEAIAWTIKLQYNTPTETTLAHFNDWLERHPSHREAWQRVSTFKVEHSKVPVKLARATLNSVHQQLQQQRRRMLKALGFAALSMGSGWLASDHTPWQRMVADVSTTVGEQRTLTLSDGTTLTLNTDSAVSTHLTGSTRRIKLQRGEIRIDTGEDVNQPGKRPFFVDTPFGPIQAIGTRFTVRLYNHGAKVAVQEGAVRLFPAHGAVGTLVQTGEYHWLGKTHTEKLTNTAMDPASWADGVITAENMRLEDLIRELARYRTGILRCHPGIADQRVSGIFQIQQIDNTLQFLARTEKLRLTYRTQFWIHIEGI